MRHLLLAATMLTVALVITFGAASALQGVASARGPAVEEDQLQPAKTPRSVIKAGGNRRMTSLFH
jgi:hypothetical protein